MPTALITGASRGLGKSTAKLFASAGWDLLLIARDEDALDQLSIDLSPTGSSVLYRPLDLSKPNLISPAIEDLINDGQVPEVLINNAGVAWTGDLLSMSLEKWEWLMQVNLTSVFQVCSSVVPLMRNKGGLIVNVSSHASRNAFSQWGAYCVSKAALSSFTKCLAEEERKHLIRACTLTLGAVNTSLWDTETVQSNFDREAMLSEDDVAAELLHLAQQPSHLVVEDLTLMPAVGKF